MSERSISMGDHNLGPFNHIMRESVPAHLRMHGENARNIILNVVAIMKRKYRGRVLWSLVGDITGHGSGYSCEICKSARLEPCQTIGTGDLKDYTPNTRTEP